MSAGAVNRTSGLSLYMHMTSVQNTESPAPGIHLFNQAISPCELSLADARDVGIDSRWFVTESFFRRSAEKSELKETWK